MTSDNLLSIVNSWPLLAAIVVLSLFWLWQRRRPPILNLNIPPCPVQPWPVVGHFVMLRGDLRGKMKKWRKKTGGLYSLYLGRQLNILVNDFDIIKEIMNKHSDSIVNTPHSFTNDILGEFDKGIVSAKDDNWKEQRAISLSILRSFGMGKDLMATKMQAEVTVLCEKFSALKGQAVDPKLLIHTCVSNVICSVSFGERFQHDDPSFQRIVEAVHVIQKYAMLTVMLSPLKILHYLPWDIFHTKKWARAAFVASEFIKSYITKFTLTSNQADEPENFITAYLKEMKKMKEKDAFSNLSEANLNTVVRTLFIAGTDSTTATILWCLLYMIHNPAVQEKVYHELEENIGTDRLPCVGDKQKLPYLNAVVMETQRLASVIPTCLRREVSSPFEVRGFTIPEGSIIWPILDSVHHDANIWGDPDKFRPERFIADNGALINREELIPFGLGRRICIGESLVRMELFLFLSSLIQRFRFEHVGESDDLPSLKECFAVVCMPKDFQIKIISRRE